MSIQRTGNRPKTTRPTTTDKANQADKSQKADKAPAPRPVDKADVPAATTEVRAKGPKRAGSRQVAQGSPVAAQLERKIRANTPAPHAPHSKDIGHADHGPHGNHGADAAGGADQARIGGAFKKLTKDGKFTKADSRDLMAQVRKNGISERESATLEKLEGSRLAGKLTRGDTKRLSNTVTKLLAEYHAQPEVDRKDILKDLQSQNLSWTASSLADKLGLKLSEPRKYTLASPVDDTNTSFDGRTGTPAKKYQMNIDNRNIDIIVEEPRTGGQFSETQIADALSQVRPELLQHVDRVELLNQNSGSASMQTNYYKEQGTIEVLPISSERSVTQGAHILNHEIGHLQTRATLGYDDANWQTYANAISADKRFPSRYAQTKPSEDFSEFVTLHELFRNTPEEGAFRALFPNRYAAAGDLLS